MEEFEDLALRWLQANRTILSPKTTSRRLTSLRAFVKWARWPTMLDDYNAPTPAKGQPHPLPEGIEGVRRLLSATGNQKYQTLVALCGYCGCRVAEALAVRPSHFRYEDGATYLTIRGKGDKTRIVPVSDAAWEILSRSVVSAFVEGDDREIVGMQDRFARRVITELGAKAGLKRHISSHDLRATFATATYDKTLDQRVVQMLLGHSDGRTTEGYIGRSMDQMRNAVEDL